VGPVTAGDASEVVGRGSGINDVALQHKTAVIDAALARIGERTDDPIATLAALGSADLAASTGYLPAAARLGVPALLDGLMAVAYALTASPLGQQRGTPRVTGRLNRPKSGAGQTRSGACARSQHAPR
jgi:NaMN:DMB phosphoribosyltransferase